MVPISKREKSKKNQRNKKIKEKPKTGKKNLSKINDDDDDIIYTNTETSKLFPIRGPKKKKKTEKIHGVPIPVPFMGFRKKKKRKSPHANLRAAV